jgi:mannose-6-phosphate isomerase
MTAAPSVEAPLVLPPNQPADRFYLGGDRIAEFRGLDPTGGHVPEDWIGSATTVAGFDELGLTVLADGTPLPDAIRADPEGWLGKDHVDRFGADPALLVKLLDAGERLPVHVHPDDAWAQSHLGCRNGKTESWIILSADRGAQVHLGFHSEVGERQLLDWVTDQDRDALLSALHAVDVVAGDSVFVPAGLPHAIGSGILLLELQQAADLSLLLEYDGFAIDGGRDGHLGVGFEKALSCVRRSALSRDELRELRGRIDDGHIFPQGADSFFRADRHTGSAATELEAGFSILVVLRGAGRISWGIDKSEAVQRGSTVLVPAGVGPMRIDGDLTLVQCRPPAGRAAMAG